MKSLQFLVKAAGCCKSAVQEVLNLANLNGKPRLREIRDHKEKVTEKHRSLNFRTIALDTNNKGISTTVNHMMLKLEVENIDEKLIFQNVRRFFLTNFLVI
ncbi:hypothetical protein K501DRAFT_274075 [Backusella circina FSU 941]|nr:hypothetical protein K501DRAFT_274075 [Backusella circina FSU 941]